MKANLPKFLEPVLWSYNLKDIDIKKDEDLIIQQVLNWGTEKEIKWLFKTYTKRKIKQVLNNPKRGCWQARVLNYWLKIFDIKINDNTYKLAIRDINPSLEKNKLIKKVLNKKIK